ncbi:FISUMP domain-containing protein [Polaribacter sp.]|uniref:FISUMP domain-containing protein n=1 Tax=Polaribacter sp. TaxID=1920175 RepID=UPI003EF09C93
MKKLKRYCLSISMLITIFTSCSDDNSTPEVSNELPIIEILTQIDVTDIIIGSTLTIETNITDSDGLITEAKLSINDIEIETINSLPFNFTWNTQSETEGVSVVKIAAFDDKGSSTIIEKQVILSANFTCGNDFFDTRDGNIYKTIQIGNQCWMAQNLNYKTTEGCWNYLNNEINGEIYGKLYSRENALIVSPEGWHLPTDEEWKILEGTVDSQFTVGDEEWNDWSYRGFDAGKNLKSTTMWIENGNGTDSFGFNALPGGFRTGSATNEDNNFENLGFSAPFWTSTSAGSDLLWNRELFSSKNTVHRSFENSWAFAIRCIKN